MNQPSISYFYPPAAAAAGLYSQDGGGAAHGWHPDSAKQNQPYQPQWDNNAAFHVSAGNNYGPGGVQVQGGGVQNRVQVGPQQPQQPSQPPPTSTPPNLHGDMSKQPAMQNQQAQHYAQQRQINQSFSIQRGMTHQPPRLQSHTRAQILNYTNMSLPPGVLAQASPQAIVYNSPAAAALMYQPPRPGGAPYANSQFMQQQIYFNAAHPAAAPPFYQQVIPQGAYQGVSSGGPSPQAGAQQPPVQMMRPNLVPSAPVQPGPPPKPEPRKRPNAIKIIDPNTNQEVPIDSDNSGNNNNITPTRSNDSSARETPQPNAGISTNNEVAAEFAARVAARAIEAESQSSHEIVQDCIPSDGDNQVTQHKQPTNVVPSSEKVFTVLSTASKEFVPTSLKPAQSSETPTEETRTPIVPTVSAETNSPAIEIQRPKEQYPTLKNPTVPSGPNTQSPMRVNSKKQKGSENERQYTASAAQVHTPPPSFDNKDINKKGQKSSLKEDLMPPPKDRRERPRTMSKETSPSPSPDSTIHQPEVSVVPAPLPSAKEVKSNVTPPPVAPEEPAKSSQHQNGETVVAESSPSIDGNKTARQRNKKGGGKMRELNRKGVEKEGSEMDAFTTEPIVSEERPMSPLPQPEVLVPATLILPPSTEPTTPLPHTITFDKIKDDLAEKEDKLVAAKNEENAKVSALLKPEEPAPVIEKSAPQLTLKRSYKKDQWSPLNPDGRKKYERDFLLDLKTEPNSNVKPDNLPDVVAVLRDSNNMRNQSMNFPMNRVGDIGGLIPPFLRNSQSTGRGPPPKRGSQQGPKGGGKGNPKVIHVSLSLHEDVKLRTTENAWKPTRLNADVDQSEDDKLTQELFKNVRGILNKLTPQKFERLMQRFLQLPINTEERLKGVINLIFEKAVDEPNFSKAYANMCKVCSRIEITKNENGVEQKVNFRKLLINRCQTEFESNKPEMLDSRKWLDDIKNCTDPEKKKELQLEYEEKERILRMKSVGNIRFIGELFKLQMLTTAIMYRCIEHLLSNPEEESLECLCKLLTTIGKDLDNHPAAQARTPQQNTLNPYFQRMAELAQKRDGSKVSSRVRFMLQDVIELRQNKWVPRREDNNPKTIDQITKEAERESLETTIALNQQPPPRMNRQNDRPDDRKKGNRGSNQNDDGWTNVGARHHYNKYGAAFEASKMQNMVKPDMDLNSLSLGGSQQFRFNSSAAKGVDSRSVPTFTSNNAFSALSRGDERKPPPQPNNNNRRITPTPSIEKDKERQRINMFPDEMGRGSRGNSAQRERPNVASRDSSAGARVPVDNKETEMSEPRHESDEKAAQLAEEKLERQTNAIIDEYLASITSVEDVRQELEQLFNADTIGMFVQKALALSLEKKAGSQKTIGELIANLMDYVDHLLTPQVVIGQLAIIYEDADDLSIDVPKVWELQAQVIVPIISAEKMDFSHFKAACSSVLKSKASSKLLVPVLALLVKDKGTGFVRKVWDSSNVNFKDFLPSEENVDAFIKNNSLEYLTGEAPKYQESMGLVQEKMLRLMQSNQPYEKILDLISANVGDKTEDLQFIRALITAICEACVSGSNHSFDNARFKQYEKLIQRFVDNKEDRELACLNSVHNLVSKLEHPQGLIKNIFNLLLDNGLISSESFLKWRKDDSEKLENKGVSIYALTSFFSALEDADTDEDNS